MWRLTGLLVGVAVLLFSLPLASACGPDVPEDEWEGCPEYTYTVGDESTGVAFNERGQAAVYATAFYVFWDSTYGVTNDGHLFSVWIYHETNREPGPQRSDDYCQEAPPEDADTYPC